MTSKRNCGAGDKRMRVLVTRRLLTTVGIIVFAAIIYHVASSLLDPTVVRFYTAEAGWLLVAVGVGIAGGIWAWLAFGTQSHTGRVVLLCGWAIANSAATLFMAGALYGAVYLTILEGSPLGQTVARNAHSGNLKHIFGLCGVLIGAGVAVSWWRFVRAAVRKEIAAVPPSQSQKGDKDMRRVKKTVIVVIVALAVVIVMVCLGYCRLVVRMTARIEGYAQGLVDETSFELALYREMQGELSPEAVDSVRNYLKTEIELNLRSIEAKAALPGVHVENLEGLRHSVSEMIDASSRLKQPGEKDAGA